MKNHTFINHKIGSQNHGTKLQNLVMLFLTILIGLGSITVFSLNIESNFGNATQTIARIVISTDGTDGLSSRIYDINNPGGTGLIKAYLDRISDDIQKSGVRASGNDRKILGIDMTQQSDSGYNLVFIAKDYFTHILSGISLSGAQGPQGPRGETGAIGPQGNTGINGANGATGLQGIPGTTGLQGIPGATGLQGIPGATGPQGIPGATGPQGIPGTTGPQGIPGATGPQGIPGATGPQGNTGIGIGDDLGNHTATTNLIMGSHYISNDGNPNEGIGFDNNNNLLIKGNTLANGKITTYKTIKISDNIGLNFCSPVNAGEIRFKNNCFQGCDGLNRLDLGGWGCQIGRDFDKWQ